MFHKSHPLIISTMIHTITTSITKLYIFIILVVSPSHLTNAQYLRNNPTSSNFQPSLFLVIGVLSFMFSLTLALLIYAKFCHQGGSDIHSLVIHEEGMSGITTRFSGLDKRVVESLPFFKFSSLKGSKQGLQCSICLAEFQDCEVLRLLPNCKHGFHIECIDLWLEKHSSCPLCRQNITAQDMENFINSTSMRFSNEEKTDESSDQIEPSSSVFELFIQREDEDDNRHENGSSKWSIGESFRRLFKTNNEEEEMAIYTKQDSKANLHRLNHKILISNVVLRNRWSNVSSSDLMFLNSRILKVMPSGGSSWSDHNKYAINYHESEDQCFRNMTLRQEIERKMKLEHKIDQIKRSNSHSNLNGIQYFDYSRQNSQLVSGDKRALSEISGVSRFKDLISVDNKVRECLEENINVNCEVNYGGNDIREEIKRRKIWFLIAKRTLQWFVSREKNRNRLQQQQPSQNIEHVFDI